MKVICQCGAKYAFDATPEMLRHPVSFACPGCGADLSASMNELVRQELGGASAPGLSREGLAPATEIAPPPSEAGVSPEPVLSLPPPPSRIVTAATPPSIVAPQPPPAPIAAKPTIRVHRSVSGAPAAAATEDVKDVRFCPKHPRERVTEKCRVCAKPICPQCMQLFGYVCSPHCKEKADLQGIEIPRFEGQRDVVEGKRWRKIGLIAGSIAAVLLAMLGTWVWYAWFGSRPKPIVTLRFENESAMSGMSAVCGNGQMVFIHGDKLARYDLKTKKEVWLRHLLDKKKLSEQAEAGLKEMQAAAARGEGWGKLPRLDDYTKDVIQSAEKSLQLRVQGQNIWVADGEKVKRYDWDNGTPRQEVEFTGDFSDAVLRGDNLEFREQVGSARMSVTRFNLVSGKVEEDEIGEKAPVATQMNLSALIAAAGAKGGAAATPGGLRGMNPQQLGAAVANAPLAGKLASPATLSVAMRQQEALNMMDEMDSDVPAGGISGGLSEADLDKVLLMERSELIPTEKGFVQITSRMTEKNIVVRSAAKAAPKKSALDGTVNAAATMDIANELLNEMSRNAGADMVREDHSKYRVKIHLGGGKDVPDWEGEVVGAPEVYPQPSVNVLAAGKTLIVLDQQNQKKWESTLNYFIAGEGSFLEQDEADRRGLGPVVERGDTLYVYDQGVLSAFELNSGQARWRLPSVGIAGMFFDDEGMIYLNTTTASPEKIKYSRQIDVMNSPGDIVLKLDPKDGKEIWKHSMGGRIAYLSGKYIYTLSYTMPRDDDDEYDENLAALGLESKPYVRIRRISPKNGRVLWDHYQPRGALDVQIHDNMFQLVLKKEVQVLKFLSL
jgi:hypothetical protein